MTVVADCKGVVVRLARGIGRRARLAIGEHPGGGLARSIACDVKELWKVRAHVDVGAARDEQEEADIRGNEAADAEAKEAAGRHR